MHLILAITIGCLVAITLILIDIARTLDAIRRESRQPGVGYFRQP